jgi:ABC-type transport system involved in multi-copper enzyme maturation permease subunit
MPSAVRTWLRTHLAWSNSRQSWQERGSALVLVAAALVLAWFGARLPRSQQVLLAGLLVLALAALLRRGWVRLFGPVLFFDLVRLGRRGRLFLYRGLYAGFLAFLLLWVYLLWQLDESASGAVRASQMAAFAGRFFELYVSVQFIALVVLTPAYVAGAVAEEKERQTLEFVLATDLRGREIVLSKLAARLASLVLIAVTGLPILSLLQFVGGVDPNLVLVAFALTGLTMAGLAGLSILNSVWARKPRDAIAFTYLGAAAYLIVSGLSLLLLLPGLGLGSWPSTPEWASPVTVEGVVRTVNAGNIVAVLLELNDVLGKGKPLDDALPALLRGYAVFHGLVFLLGAAWAVVRMRAIAVAQLYDKPRQPSLGRRVWGRPRVGRWPMVWKELFAEPGLRLNWFGWLLVAVLILVCFTPAVWIIAYSVSEMLLNGNASWKELGETVNLWLRVAGTLVACLLLMTIGVRAASSVSGERDRQTLDSLLTTPLGPSAILGAKWLGSLLSVRWAVLWLAVIWAIGLATGGLHPLALPVLVLAWLVYAAFAAMLGLWFSLTSRTSLRATIWTLLASVAMSVGHWFVMMMCFYVPLQSLAGIDEGLRWLPEFEAFGLTPPVSLALLAVQGWELEDHFLLSARDFLRWCELALVGVACWAAATTALWFATVHRFRVLTGRNQGPGFRSQESGVRDEALAIERRGPTVPDPAMQTPAS